MSKKNKVTAYQNNHFDLKLIRPLTPNQEDTFNLYYEGFNLVLHGYAGTGKTYISLFLALNDILKGGGYDHVVLVRSVVPSRDMGFLPGTITEKIQVYEDPYREICDDLFGRGDGYDILKLKGFINFTTTSFLRGTTFNNAIVIVDEMQNMSFQEIDTVMTRLGNNTRVIFCGDYRQTDLVKDIEKAGIKTFMEITERINKFRHVEFDQNDIVRSGIVKDYIIQRTAYGC